MRYSLWVAIIYCMSKFFLIGQILGWMLSQQKGGEMKQTNEQKWTEWGEIFESDRCLWHWSF